MKDEQQNIFTELEQPDNESLSAVDLRVINFLPVAEDKLILDVCCGSRMFWFNKNNPSVIYMDKRKGTWETDKRKGRKQTTIEPDTIANFEKIPFADKTFNLIVFDPPHLLNLKENTRLAKKYGTLTNGWQPMIKKGFAECFRVLKENGILIFKWNEYHIPLSKILKLTTEQPLFGNRSGKQSKTHWVVFMKTDRQKHL